MFLILNNKIFFFSFMHLEEHLHDEMITGETKKDGKKKELNGRYKEGGWREGEKEEGMKEERGDL